MTRTGKLTPLEQLDTAIRTVASEADPGVSSRELAEGFYEDQRTLVDPFIGEWVIEKLATLLSKNRAKVRRERNVQTQFELSLGIMRRPRRLTLKSGEEVARYRATLPEWKSYRARLWETGHPDLEYADKVVALMEAQSLGDKRRGITYGEVIERECVEKSKAAVR